MGINVLVNMVARFWGVLSGIIFVPLYIKYLGFDGYSVITLMIVIASFLAVLDSGMTATITREFAREDQSSEEKIKRFCTIEIYYLSIILASLFLVVALSERITSAFSLSNVSAENEGELYVIIITLETTAQLIMRFYIGGMIGLNRQVEANIYLIVWGTIRNGAVIIVLQHRPDLVAFFLWQAASTLFFLIVARIALSKLLAGQPFYFKPSYNLTNIKPLWRFAAGMLSISIIAAINTQLDKLYLGLTYPLEVLGNYNLATSLAMILVTLASPISTAFLPKLIGLHSTEHTEARNVIYIRLVRFVSTVVFSAAVILAFNAKGIIWIWTGDTAISANSAEYLPILTIAYAMLSLAVVPFTLAVASGYTRLNATLGIISIMITVPGYWLVGQQFGAIGTASVYCGVQTIVTLFYFYFINRKFLPKSNFIGFMCTTILVPMSSSIALQYVLSETFDFELSNRLIGLLIISLNFALQLLLSFLILYPTELFVRVRKILNKLR